MPQDEREEGKQKKRKKISLIELLINARPVILYLILAIRHDTMDFGKI